MTANVTAEYRVQLSQAAYYLGKCVRSAEVTDYSPTPTARAASALTMLSSVLGMPSSYLAQLSSKAQETAGPPTSDRDSEITLWTERYTDHLADALYVALTPGD